jgi:hypothetical protein
LALSLTGGNAHDITQAETLAAPAEALLGDKGYDTDSFTNSIEVCAIKAATRYEKTARNFPWRAASGLRTRLAQMTRGLE